MDIKFLKFELAKPDDKYLGMATIISDHKIMLTYKVVETERGMFIAPPSYKDSNDEWQKFFIIDSQIAEESIRALIKSEVNKHMNKVASGSAESGRGKESFEPEDDLPF
jgi:DNA-binding cell septation regulator SpoVG